MPNGNGGTMVVSHAGRFNSLKPVRTAEPQAASTPVLQMLVQGLIDLNRKVDALASTGYMPMVDDELEEDLPAPPSPQQLERGKLRDMFD